MANDAFQQIKAFELTNVIPVESDYSHSSNSLFHFMKKRTYLQTALERKRLAPRYCIEHIDYLDIQDDGTCFDRLAVLQLCFCDIPLHKICLPTAIAAAPDQTVDPGDTSHVGIYGCFGIAFSKIWCEHGGLQPIRYINPFSVYAASLHGTVLRSLSQTTLSPEDANDILYRLAFTKPLRGRMDRPAPNGKGTIEIQKNFFDEQEWRYVPSAEKCSEVAERNDTDIPFAIANKNFLYTALEHFKTPLNAKSDMLSGDDFKDLSLCFSYQDIRYLIVPNSEERDKLIHFIQKLPDSAFEQESLQKEVLFSRILVLDEIRKDW